MNELFPEIEPFDRFYFRVSPIHELYVERVGNPKGQPVLFLHGGPGAGITEKHRRYFDPQHYHIILFDQRGAGKSKPFAELRENTIWDLVDDIEKLRERIGVERWMVFGGSWGSTLGLAYAQTHHERVTHLVLRGIFLCRKEEIDWFYQSGASFIFPDLWKDYLAPIPESERGDLVRAYYRQLTDENVEVRKRACRAWAGWEGGTIHLLPDRNAQSRFMADEVAIALARIECHYFINRCWYRCDDQLLQDAHKIKNIPTKIIHGRYDVVCPVKNAFDLKEVLPSAGFEIIPDAGHAVDEPGILRALIQATNEFKN